MGVRSTRESRLDVLRRSRGNARDKLRARSCFRLGARINYQYFLTTKHTSRSFNLSCRAVSLNNAIFTRKIFWRKFRLSSSGTLFKEEEAVCFRNFLQV